MKYIPAIPEEQKKQSISRIFLFPVILPILATLGNAAKSVIFQLSFIYGYFIMFIVCHAQNSPKQAIHA